MKWSGRVSILEVSSWMFASSIYTTYLTTQRSVTTCMVHGISLKRDMTSITINTTSVRNILPSSWHVPAERLYCYRRYHVSQMHYSYVGWTLCYKFIELSNLLICDPMQPGASFEGAGGRRPPPHQGKIKEKREKRRKKKERKKGTTNNVKLLHIKCCFSNFSIVRWHWKINKKFGPPRKSWNDARACTRLDGIRLMNNKWSVTLGQDDYT